MVTGNQKIQLLTALALASQKLAVAALILADGMATGIEETPDGVPIPPAITAETNVANAILLLKLDALNKDLLNIVAAIKNELRVGKEGSTIQTSRGVN